MDIWNFELLERMDLRASITYLENIILCYYTCSSTAENGRRTLAAVFSKGQHQSRPGGSWWRVIDYLSSWQLQQWHHSRHLMVFVAYQQISLSRFCSVVSSLTQILFFWWSPLMASTSCQLQFSRVSLVTSPLVVYTHRSTPPIWVFSCFVNVNK